MLCQAHVNCFQMLTGPWHAQTEVLQTETVCGHQKEEEEKNDLMSVCVELPLLSSKWTKYLVL